jgi:hypothetical protein
MLNSYPLKIMHLSLYYSHVIEYVNNQAVRVQDEATLSSNLATAELRAVK